MAVKDKRIIAVAVVGVGVVVVGIVSYTMGASSDSPTTSYRPTAMSDGANDVDEAGDSVARRSNSPIGGGAAAGRLTGARDSGEVEDDSSGGDEGRKKKRRGRRRGRTRTAQAEPEEDSSASRSPPIKPTKFNRQRKP